MALEIFNRVKSIAIDSSAFLCLVDKGIAEVQAKILKKTQLHAKRSKLRETSDEKIGRGFGFKKSLYL